MKDIARAGVMIMILLWSTTSSCYFYYFCVVKTTMRNGKSPQLIILLADYHDKTNSANKTQRAHLEALLEKHRADKVKLIVEDLSSVNNDGRMMCGSYGINCADGVLGHLAHKARNLGIAVDNVEYRYCRVAGIGPLLNNITADPYSFRSSATITLVSLHKEIVDEIEKVKKYDDGKKLNAIYRQTIGQVSDALSHMRLSTKNAAATVAHHCAQLHQRTYRQELEKLCVFDSALIDINIMHSIAGSDAPVIFVVAGGSHIEQVNAFLKRIGREVVFATHVHQGTPQPIDITPLDKFIK